MPHPDPLALHCPECGYGLEVLRGLWVDSCPLRSNCPECGEVIEWAEMLGTTSPGRALRLLPGRAGKILRLLYLVLCAYFPASVWREARRMGRESPGRSVLVGAVGAFFSYWLLSTSYKWVAFLLALYDRYLATTPNAYWGYGWRGIGVFRGQDVDAYLVSPWVVIGAVMFFVIPLVILAFPSVADRPDLSRVWRIWAYSLVTLPLALVGYPLLTVLGRYGGVVQNYGRFVGVRPNNFGAVHGLVTIFVATAWLVVWWRYAMRDYLSLKDAWARAIGMALISLLVVAVVTASSYIVVMVM